MRSTNSLMGAGLLSVVAGAPAWAGDGTVQYRIVALQGQPAQGTPPGVVFARFSGPGQSTFPRPAIDAEGNQAHFAILAGPGITFGNSQSVWSEKGGGGGTLGLLARGGDPAPGTPVFFSSFPNLEVPGEPIIRGGRAAFMASLSGPGVIHTFNSHGIWSGHSGSIALVLRDADPAPGLPGVRFADPYLLAFNAQGHTLISSRLAGTGVSTSNDESLWTDRSGALALVAREGQPAPGTEPGVVFGFGQIGAGPSVFPRAVMNDTSLIAFEATLAGPGITYHNDEALYLETPQGPQLLVREGQPAPGAGNGVTFGGNSVQLFIQIHSLNTAGQIAFSVNLGGSIPTTGAEFSTYTGALTQLVRSGQPAPGTGTNFTIVGGVRLSEAGRVAFAGSTAIGFAPPLGVWWDQHGPIQPLLLPGASPPSLGGATVTSTGRIVGYAASGLVALRAALDHPQIGGQTALLLVEPDGAVHKVVASGELFDATGQGDLRTVYIITPGGLSETGEFAFRVRFTDGTEGHYGASLDNGCYPDCNSDGAVNLADFGCFQTKFALGDPYADCNGDSDLNLADFGCFQTEFALGCP